MSNGIIEIKENDINEISAYLKNSSNKIVNSCSSLDAYLANITKTGLLRKGTAKIKNQMNSIGQGISSVSASVIKQYEAMELVENNLKNKADSIEIPMDFVKNDTSRSVDINSGKLKKEDGKAINANDNTKTEELKFDSIIEYNENLKYIVKDYEEKNHKIELNGDKTLLKKIKNNRTININDKLDDSIIVTKDMKNIKNDNSININDKLDASVVKKAVMSNIKGNLTEMTAKINLELPVDRINLTQFNASNFQISDIDVNYKINRKRLTSINK